MFTQYEGDSTMLQHIFALILADTLMGISDCHQYHVHPVMEVNI